MTKDAIEGKRSCFSGDLDLPSTLRSHSANTTVDTETISPPLSECSSSSPQGVRPPSQNVQAAIKILVSNHTSGSIIGRRGTTITDLQIKSRARIKLSKAGDFFPGTSDRVCLIQGSLSCVATAVEMVIAKLYDIHRLRNIDAPASRSSDDHVPAGTPFTVKILLPASSCGMIIGHGGSHIKMIKEKSGVSFIQLSPKATDVIIDGSIFSTSERIMIIVGPSFDSCVNCIHVILDDLAGYPEMCRYVNMTTSYSIKPAFFQSSYTTCHMTQLSPSSEYQNWSSSHSKDQNINQTTDFQRYSEGILPPFQREQYLPYDSFSATKICGTVTETTGCLQQGLPFPSLRGMEFSTEIEISDSMIGSILGRGGKVLNRIQSRTQTCIRVSQRGAKNRTVTIVGLSSESVGRAIDQINERISISAQFKSRKDGREA